MLFSMEASFDWVQFAIDRPMVQEPGAAFKYNSGATQLLSHIFTRATGKDIEEYAQQYLFAPLGIERFYWKRSPTGLEARRLYRSTSINCQEIQVSALQQHRPAGHSNFSGGVPCLSLSRGEILAIMLAGEYVLTLGSPRAERDFDRPNAGGIHSTQ